MSRWYHEHVNGESFADYCQDIIDRAKEDAHWEGQKPDWLEAIVKEGGAEADFVEGFLEANHEILGELTYDDFQEYVSEECLEHKGYDYIYGDNLNHAVYDYYSN